MLSTTTPSTTPYASITCYLTIKTNIYNNDNLIKDEEYLITNSVVEKYYLYRKTNLLFSIRKTTGEGTDTYMSKCKYKLEFVDNYNFRIYSESYRGYMLYHIFGNIYIDRDIYHQGYGFNSDYVKNTFNLLSLKKEVLSFQDINNITDYYIIPSAFKSELYTVTIFKEYNESYIFAIADMDTSYYNSNEKFLVGSNYTSSKSSTYAEFNIEILEKKTPTIYIDQIKPTIKLLNNPTTTFNPTTTQGQTTTFNPTTTMMPITTFKPTTTIYPTTIRPFITIPKNTKIKLTISSLNGSPKIRLANFTNIDATNIITNGSGYDIKNILTNNNITGTSWRSTNLNTTNYIQINTNDNWNINKEFYNYIH